MEIGVGTGTDLLQFARAGAIVTGVDLTEEAIEHAKHRLLPKFSATTRLHRGRVETLPFESNSFDLAYSWGVLHHTENTEVSLKEVVRTVAPGGEVKIMLYNRYSICTLAHWVKYGLFRGKPWRSFRWILAHHLESPGTRAYTRGEIRGMISRTGLKLVSIETVATPWDYLPVNRVGFFHMIRAAKP
jgi:ubiquinone/menaquinone biosynthesis C-methylase UbiE